MTHSRLTTSHSGHNLWDTLQGLIRVQLRMGFITILHVLQPIFTALLKASCTVLLGRALILGVSALCFF